MDSALILLVVAVLILALSIGLFLWLLKKSEAKKESEAAADPEARSGELIGAQVSGAVSALRDMTVGGLVDVRVPWILLTGEHGCGKTDLVNQLGSASPGTALPRGGVDWRFLDAGAILDVPGSFLIGADGRGQKDGRWNRLLRALVRYRPERPLDGLVLAVSAKTLVGCDEKCIAARTAVAAAMRIKLDEAQKVTGLVLPVYLLVTGCEAVAGFGSFCWEIDPDHDDDMFGWSNPHTLETAFAEEWVDEAFDEVAQRISLQQLKVYGSRSVSTAPEELFLFPVRFDSMRSALRAFATEIFRETVYVDCNYLRGIYFCGDPSVVINRASQPGGLAATVASMALSSNGPQLPGDALLASPMLPIQAPRGIGQIVFVRHLFDFKVFAESRIARPVSGIRLSRNRKVLALQAATLLFAIVAGLGTWIASNRMSQRISHLSRLLGSIQQNQEERRHDESLSGKQQHWQSQVEHASDLMISLGNEEVGSLRTVFLPASYFDSTTTRVADALTGEFNRTLLPALYDGLEAKSADLLDGAPTEPPPCSAGGDEQGSDVVVWSQDPNYVALNDFVSQYVALADAVNQYQILRGFQSGSAKQVDDLFYYLIGKHLPAGTARGPWFQRALAGAQFSSLDLNKGYAANKATLLATRFLNSWVSDNRLLTIKDNAARSLADLDNRRITGAEDLESVAENLGVLDETVTLHPPAWLAEATFKADQYPALKRLQTLDFATDEMIASLGKCGQDQQTAARDDLLLDIQGSKNPLLEQHGNEIEVSAAISALSNGIRWLLQQDFMNSAQTPPRLTVPILWDAAALNKTKALRDNYDRFVKERLPGLPPLERAGLQNAALSNLGQAMANGVWRAASPPANRGEDELLLEIKSLRDAAPVLEQLLETVPRSATGLNGLRNLLSMQAMDLATRLNSDLTQKSPYKYSDEGLRNWDGVRPLSQVIWDADSPELLDDYLAGERDHMRSLATDYAQPLDAWLQNNGLERAADFSRWVAIIKDLKDYDAKKPGNPLGVLETFIRTGEDKIIPAQGCASATQAAAAGDYFIAIRSSVQAKIHDKCANLLLNAYNTNAAAFFNQKLKGHFPFGPLPQGSSVSMADPSDTGQFFTRVAQQAQPFLAFVAKNPVNADARAFVESADAARQMFAGGLNEGKPFVDVAVSFRANQSAEVSGNEIIDWELSAGDQKARFPGPEGGIRWHYGDPIRIQMRFARDSPDVPKEGSVEPGMSVDERTVTWDFTTRWSLFELLVRHSAQTSDFGSGGEASRGLLSFDIPIVADTSRIKGANPAAAKTGTARVYIRLGLRVTEGKDQKEVQLAPFPQQAPTAQPPASDSTAGGSGLPPGKSILE